MSVLARPKSSDKSLSHRRSRRSSLPGVARLRSVASGSGDPNVGSGDASAEGPATNASPAAPGAHASGDVPATSPQPVVHVDHAMSTLDQAVYTCECGFVFEAEVLTTVACPHCGCGQAW